ncbi:cytochrome P450 [Nocardia sp. NPDC057353]|uniref:cytochrome P450 n=1 Tax=Nocardia sp. NPDC057353 TaxID=3346104 RepID=UPI00362833AB
MTQLRELRPATIEGAADAARVLAEVLAPTVAQGAILRRPRMVALAERLRLDARAVALLRRLRARRGPAPVRLPLPGLPMAVLLDPLDVARLLAGEPGPFEPAAGLKRAALDHFQPHGVLVSRGRVRARRRAFTETALQTPNPVHAIAPELTARAEETARTLLRRAGETGELDWDTFAEQWWRLVRTVALGTAARDDTALTDELARLRTRANWAFAAPRDEAGHRRLAAGIQRYLDAAEPGTLAAAIAAAAPDSDIEPADQVAHWLFAFDAAGITAFRTLALLAANPAQDEWARQELPGAGPSPFERLRACVLDTVRLWPTTPMILRQSTAPSTWHGRKFAAGTTFLVFAPLFHRDPDSLGDTADRFTPELWLDGRADEHPALVPFSAGPGVCPGRNVVLLTTSTLLAALLREQRFGIAAGAVPAAPVPAGIDHFRIRLSLLR